MTDKLQRPLRPDEELVRFHNGDTLDNIPIVRLPIPSSRRPFLWWGAVIVPVAVFGALAGAAVAHIEGDSDSSAQDDGKSSAVGSTPLRESEPEAGPEQVSVIQAPKVQGDVATSFCLVYTGSWSSGAREAVLLIEAPAYQCTDLLRYAPEDGGAFSEVPVLCQTPARAAVLSFAESSGWWGGEVYFTCLTRHSGA
ncbi:hypothetical protein [Streptomyces sp. NBC_00620]|uniref:hypothetical protein n=1 Tax=unclassified Streptomyces TaxID=2593676 RepID=UPI00224FB1AE|nr:hypothetical protein [Streptomyces sp. NBC_00620]MCX4973288.1 hypothetical protein [Streptomyces sp. NBC_00620]WUC12296.1 hypothetical protein OG256_21470 [Streptomyces sp. NBC_00564]WUC51160.1 hypothetical protein OG266_23340 [Streptomyces sp. NBC_00554]